MYHYFFGNMNYSIGWKVKRRINVFDKDYIITVKIQASNPEQNFSEVQESACMEYAKFEKAYLEKIEILMKEYCENAETRFLPKTLLFRRNGDCAMLCDDFEDPDNGIAVCIIPEMKITLQDDFL